LSKPSRSAGAKPAESVGVAPGKRRQRTVAGKRQTRAGNLLRIGGTGDGTDNALIWGENLAVLNALHATHGQRFQCVYIDPPYNTGRTFAEYTDRVSPQQWQAELALRLHALKPLVALTGSVFIQVDAGALAATLTVADGVFGADNRLSLITVQRGGATGHKASNLGTVNVAEYIVWYASDRRHVRINSERVVRPAGDPAYRTWLSGDYRVAGGFQLRPLAQEFCARAGVASPREHRKQVGAAQYTHALATFALENAACVVRFAQPRVEAISQTLRHAIQQSARLPDAMLVVERQRLPRVVLYRGQRVLFLATKVLRVAGTLCVTEALSNIWTDIAYQGMAKEGNVRFIRNKKPEALLLRLIELSTNRGDWILDPYLGSGTTAAVAHKALRHYVGIEAGDQFQQMCIPRLTRVAAGDDQSGVSKRLAFRGGGGFQQWKLHA
jgi:adenine-specific DNA-methyltransferase